MGLTAGEHRRTSPYQFLWQDSEDGIQLRCKAEISTVPRWSRGYDSTYSTSRPRFDSSSGVKTVIGSACGRDQREGQAVVWADAEVYLFQG